MGHAINNNLKSESKLLPQNNFAKREKNQIQKNIPLCLPIPVHDTEVEKFFKSQNYPLEEARKFFNHYKAIGWKIKGITPIEDWQAAAHKWMLNTGKYQETKLTSPEKATIALNEHFEMYKAEKKNFLLITEDHFSELKLTLTPEIMKLARKERIDQLIGSNQNSILQLLQAYQQNNANDKIIIS